MQQALADEDLDAPPPKWVARTQSMSAPYSLLLGIGLVLISTKHWVFTLSAVGAIRDSGISTRAGVLTFVAYVALAVAIPITLIAVTVFGPDRSARMLDACQIWLQRHKGPVVISFSLVFGTWFLLAGLSGLGVIRASERRGRPDAAVATGRAIQ